jgi:Lar family restriction alleviation protein
MREKMERLTERKWENEKEIDLAGCPFCGSNDVVREDVITQVRVYCRFCGITTPWVRLMGIAVGLWNRRSGMSHGR